MPKPPRADGEQLLRIRVSLWWRFMNLPGPLAKKPSYKGSGSLGAFCPERAEFSEALPAELGRRTNLSAGFQRNPGEKAEKRQRGDN